MRKSTIATLTIACSTILFAQVKSLKPGFNLFTPAQDIQVGQEAKAQVEKTKPMLTDTRVTGYISDLGKRLAASPRAGQFPFTFEVVRDSNINAFALPGGPVFINSATIVAADNEAQLAGVMAHEMSHVALRHGTHEASKAKALQLGAALVGAATRDTTIGALTRAGIGLGANSLLLHYSRDAESQADYNGALVMADAGYNPVEMGRFFQKLETRSSEGVLAQFLSDHPTPGNRVEAVQQEVQQLPAKQYRTDSPEFQRIRNIVRGIKVPAAPSAQ